MTRRSLSGRSLETPSPDRRVFAETVVLISGCIPRTEASFVTVKSVGLEFRAESSLRIDSGRPHQPSKVSLGEPEFLSPKRFDVRQDCVDRSSISERFCS